jgi:hypothetical protein
VLYVGSVWDFAVSLSKLVPGDWWILDGNFLIDTDGGWNG